MSVFYLLGYITGWLLIATPFIAIVKKIKG